MSTLTIVVIAAAIGLIVASAGTRSPSLRAARTARSPLDEAELILARRYARGEVSFEEYDRMTAVLRR